ncbi:penicillin-binding protein [Prochlorothrix hollandica PCC 9006 = CALU 1027]|uniref:Penicillin-binding protein n=1 Tax=Prochlorothrix hollandica PCC 9006 = CALU 1027 TaxID=317619 RepID=A0A0M2PXK0_PROHO|nr:penicillin-binding protein [Prochlorothrix hollandica PCC 9006 = CALU 1027]
MQPFFHSLRMVTTVAGGTLLTAIMLSSALAAGILVGLANSFRNLPDVRVVQNYIPSETSYIYDMGGQVLSSMHDEANRKVVTLDNISPEMKRAVMAIEDSHFYQHLGINPSSVVRALVANLSQGGVVEGGSTLTMQLVKNLFLTPERFLSRKAAEAVLAVRMEQVLEKNEILELYLNQVYWGHNTYGVETAAQSYFGKSAKDLNLAEAAMMAGFIQAPEEYSPFDGNYELSEEGLEIARWRQGVVLDRMVEVGWITPGEAKTARDTELKFGEVTSFSRSKMPYVTEAVLQELTTNFRQDEVLKGGMRIQTTIDPKMQQLAEQTISTWYPRIRQQGVQADQMSLVSIDPRTHFVKAMVGGVDYKTNQFNRATSALRQPGSAFKPFVYYAALATGKYSPSSSIADSPVSYPDGDELYSPQNYDRSFMGSISLQTALQLSRNVPAIRLGQDVGLNKVIEVCHLIGITSEMDPVISLPLGAVGVTPLEMAGAYATFASNGWYSETTLIAQVTDSRGGILLDNTPQPRLVLNPKATAQLTTMLQATVTGGTGRAAQLDRPTAGKTGTTSSERDVWFVGYVPQLATAVWIGNDDYSPLGSWATGGGTVAPIWKDYMLRALKDVPVEQFAQP